MKYAFENARTYINGGFKICSTVFDERILGADVDAGDATKIELPDDATVLPGFIDGHVHGAGGADAMDGTAEALATISATLAKEGTTTFLATTMTCPHEQILAALDAVKKYRARGKAVGARIAGVHLEGPFISPEYKGAQAETNIKTPSAELFEEYNAACGYCIKTVTLAPERENAAALIRAIVKSGATASVGHSAATHAEVLEAVNCGASAVTHTFNAQSPLKHREIGVAGSALLCDALTCELICDGIHVSPPAMRLLVKNKPHGKLVLITDAIRAKGLSDGVSELGGQTVYVKNGEARLKDGTLAGSVLKMNDAIENLHDKAGAPIEYAIYCATIAPATALGIDGECGSITELKRADFAVVDKNFDVIMTVVGGKIVYRR